MAVHMRGPFPPPVGADCCPLPPVVSHAAPCPLAGTVGVGITEGSREVSCGQRPGWQGKPCVLVASPAPAAVPSLVLSLVSSEKLLVPVPQGRQGGL